MTAGPQPPAWAPDLTGWQCPAQIDALDLIASACPVHGLDCGPECGARESTRSADVV